MKLSAVIDLIKSSDIGFKTVDGVLAIADLATRPGAVPAAYVVPTRTVYVSEQEGPGLIVIGAQAEFDIVIVIGSGQNAGRDRDELHTLAEAIIGLVLGWTPHPDCFRPVIPIAAGLSGVGGGKASWSIRFRTYSRLRKEG